MYIYHVVSSALGHTVNGFLAQLLGVDEAVLLIVILLTWVALGTPAPLGFIVAELVLVQLR